MADNLPAKGEFHQMLPEGVAETEHEELQGSGEGAVPLVQSRRYVEEMAWKFCTTSF